MNYEPLSCRDLTNQIPWWWLWQTFLICLNLISYSYFCTLLLLIRYLIYIMHHQRRGGDKGGDWEWGDVSTRQHCRSGTDGEGRRNCGEWESNWSGSAGCGLFWLLGPPTSRNVAVRDLSHLPVTCLFWRHATDSIILVACLKWGRATSSYSPIAIS